VEDILDFEFVVESLKRLADELGPIIVDDSSGHVKAVYYVMFDKFDHVRRFYSFKGMASYLEK